MKTNLMLRALDNKIADLIRQRAAIDGHLEVLKATRGELAGLVRKRAKLRVPEQSSNDGATTVGA